MNTGAWTRRLRDELPEWVAWRSDDADRPWRAAPVGDVVDPRDVIAVDHPRRLLYYCRRWFTTCRTCGVPVRDCAHRDDPRTRAHRPRKDPER